MNPPLIALVDHVIRQSVAERETFSEYRLVARICKEAETEAFKALLRAQQFSVPTRDQVEAFTRDRVHTVGETRKDGVLSPYVDVAARDVEALFRAFIDAPQDQALLDTLSGDDKATAGKAILQGQQLLHNDEPVAIILAAIDLLQYVAVVKRLLPKDFDNGTVHVADRLRKNAQNAIALWPA